MAENSSPVQSRLNELLDELIRATLERSKEIRFQSKDRQHIYSICLFGRIVEYAYSILSLTKKPNACAGLPLILRGLLEACVDLLLVLKSPEHTRTMYANFLSERRRVLNAAPTNRYLNPASASGGDARRVDLDLEEVNRELTRLAGEGVRPLKVGNKFRDAEMEDIYRSVYWALCQYSHNNMSALELRHVAKNERGDFEILFFSIDKGAAPHTFMAIEMVLSAADQFFPHFGLEGLEIAENIREQLKSLSESDSELMQEHAAR